MIPSVVNAIQHRRGRHSNMETAKREQGSWSRLIFTGESGGSGSTLQRGERREAPIKKYDL
jgi:hypothetical protein